MLLRGFKHFLLPPPQGFRNDCGERRPGTSRGRRNSSAPFWVSRLCLRLEADRSQAHLRPRQCISGGIHLFIRLTRVGFSSVQSVQFPDPISVQIQCFDLPSNVQVFSKTIKSSQKKKPTKFAIDLRSPEEIEQDLKNELDTECWALFKWPVLEFKIFRNWQLQNLEENF